jgi:hypothetical protein
LSGINEVKSFLDLFMDITKMQRVPLQEGYFGMVQLNRKAICRVVWYAFLPSCFNNLSTGRVLGPEFFKSKWPRQKAGGCVYIERDGVVI